MAPTILNSGYITASPTAITITGGKVLVVCPWAGNDADGVGGPTGVSYNSVALTGIYDGGGTARTDTAFWALPSPPTGNYNLAWTGGDAVRGLMWCTLLGIPTSNYYRTGNTNTSLGANSLTTTVTTVRGDLVLYAGVINQGGNTSGSGCTLLVEGVQASAHAGLGYEIATSTSEAGGFSWDGLAGHITVMGLPFISGVGGNQIIWML